MQQNNDRPYILGLDIGTNSIGWAVVDCKLEKNPEHKGIYAGYMPTSLRALNSRIFLEMVEAKTRVPKNQKRRTARGARNRRAYFKQRRKQLTKVLLDAGLLPESYHDNPQRALVEIDRNYAERKVRQITSDAETSNEQSYCSPYAMRNFALEERLEPYELGRLLLHLQRRRGYLSNRGAKYIELIKSLKLDVQEDDESAMDSEEKKELGKVLTAIDELASEMGGRTLGQFIWQKAKEQHIQPQRITLFQFEKSRQFRGETVIDRLQFRARREMYENEFDALREKQNNFYTLTDKQWEQIRELIFHQRPLQLQKGTIGNCNIYPDKKRSALMRLEYQEFRTLQIINNLQIRGQALTQVQRQQLAELTDNPEELNKSGRIAWKDVAKHLGVSRKNLNYSRGDNEETGKTGLPGNKTIKAICESIGLETWRKLSVDCRAQLVEDLLTIHNKKTLYNRLVNYWKLAPYTSGDDKDKKGALHLTMNESLEDGYGKHSLKALKALLPHLMAGKDYYAAAEAIGKRESITKLPAKTGNDFLLDVSDVPDIANPIVQKALYEIRRVVNAIAKRYGKPAIIRLEMAREMKSSKEHRKTTERQQAENRNRNEAAEDEILEFYKQGNPNIRLKSLPSGNQRISIDDRNKFKMWKYEQGEKCPYCQKPIGINQLFSGDTDIEHILPYTGFRQSYMNTLVSCRACNEKKGKRTPHQAWGADAERWARIEAFAKEHYKGNLFGKQRNILKKEHKPEDVDEFVKRQLNDTRYIATATKKLLEKFGVPVDVNNGAATSELRRNLGLNDVLPKKPDTSAYVSTGDVIDEGTGEILKFSAQSAKKIRQDHRHHAVDAFVVAITNRAMLKAMTELHQRKQDNRFHHRTYDERFEKTRLQLPPSWKDCQDVNGLPAVLRNKLNATVVSHMTKRKVWGALHEETLYGKSYFNQTLNLEGITKTILKKVKEITQAGEDERRDRVTDETLCAMLWQWANENEQLPATERSLPRWNNEPLTELVYQTPCITVRKTLNGDLLAKLDKEWRPGAKTWIAEKSVHEVLWIWLKCNELVSKDKKAIDEQISNEPPRMPTRKGEHGPIIHRVKIAQAMTDSYVKIASSYVIPGNNHHFVLYHNGKEGKEKTRQVRMVTMLEAARRASAGKPIIDRESPAEWGGEWHYELALCVNDMVECLDTNIFENNENFDPRHLQTPYFRVQAISSDNKSKIDLSLRHHSISGTDDKWGLWRISSLKNLNIRPLHVGNLGLTADDDS